MPNPSKNEADLLPQSLLDYYRRIGAECINFRRAMIKINKGKYYVEKCVIKVDPADGTITSYGDEGGEYYPTKAEQEQVKADWASVKLPTYVKSEELPALELADRLRRGREGSKAFVFYENGTGKVLMVQHRYDDAEGNRQFVPHTYWSDGEWRTMEPEGSLPFFKPKKATRPRIMVHEGSKAAEAAQRIADDRYSRHPWHETLALYDHWGMIGGAMAPQRTDYSELRKAKPTEVVYVCDNDEPGIEALSKVSRFYGGSMKGVRFDGRFPPSWDVADPLPEKFFNEKGHYCGPSLEKLIRPATWATDKISTGKAGRPACRLRVEFSREWFHSVKPDLYAHASQPNRTMSLTEFNSFVSPFSDAKNTGELLQKHWESKGTLLSFDPSGPNGIYEKDGELCLNTHIGSSVKSRKWTDNENMLRDAAPFVEFMEHLIPNDRDRGELIKWVVTLVARPDIKMLYGILLISEQQGVGKGTLGERIIAPIIGRHNVSYPSETDIVDSGFNTWAAHKRLAVIHEIYAGHSSKAYNKMKSLITDYNLTINTKYLAPYELQNWTHVFACSNSNAALKLSFDDRRWFVPEVTKDPKTPGYWEKLYRWLEREGGYSIIKGFCEVLAADPRNLVMRGQSAPMTETKKDVVREGYSDAMRFVHMLMEQIKDQADRQNKSVVVLDTELVRMVKEVYYKGNVPKYMEQLRTLRRVAQDAGWYIWEGRIDRFNWGAFSSRRSVPLINDMHCASLGQDELMSRIEEPTNVVDVARTAMNSESSGRKEVRFENAALRAGIELPEIDRIARKTENW